jgi:hypothetical protein
MDFTRFHLADLVDWLALDGPRDRSLVLRTAAWLYEHRSHLELETAAQAAWNDVVATLQVQERVSFVVTGRRDDVVGEWTWKVAEREFDQVWLRTRDEERPELIEFCALDYAVAGRPLLLPTGDRASALATALIAGEQQVRVKLGSGRTASYPRADVEFTDEPAE